MDKVKISSKFDQMADYILFEGDCLELLVQIPDRFVKLVITSPPYNLGKPYETRLGLDEYLSQQRRVIEECVRVLDGRGSICWQIGNVEKTIHPCQFPVELIERLVLSMTDERDWVLDPFIGVGTAAIAALMHNRRAIGAEVVPEYVKIARERIRLAEQGELRIRPMSRPVYDPDAPDVSVPPQVVHLGTVAPEQLSM